MQHLSIPWAAVFLLLLLVSPRAEAGESTSHRIAGGTFGVAWIASEGLIYVYSPGETAAPFRVNHVRAHQLVAIDYDADGHDELAIIDALKKSLFIHDFDDGKMIGGFGHNVSEITAGRFQPDKKHESVIACTYTGDTYLWDRDVGDQGWISLPGDFEKAYRGRVVSRLSIDSLVTVSRGDVFALDPVWKTYRQVLLGKQVTRAIPCDLLPSPGDEIVVACGESFDLFICKKKMAEPLGRQATALTRGRLGMKKDSLVAVTPSGTITQYDPEKRSWTELPAEQPWGDAILQDINGDGLDELFAVPKKRPEELYRFNRTVGEFQRIPHRLFDVFGKQSTVRAEYGDSVPHDSGMEAIRLGTEKIACDIRFWNTTHKPYIIRLYTPAGRNVLRDSPADHIHHHGLMFAIAANDCDFWAEFPDTPQGRQELVRLSVRGTASGSQPSEAVARLLWRNASGSTVFEEERSVRAIPYDEATLLTWSSRLSKERGKKITLSGSHYFGLGMRFVESMDNGGSFRFAGDRELSTSVRGDERVTRASWAAYTATLDEGDPVTAVIFSHPDNARPMHAFTMGDQSSAFAFLAATLNLYREPYEWGDDNDLRWAWGIALFDGNATEKSIEAAYEYWKSTTQ